MARPRTESSAGGYWLERAKAVASVAFRLRRPGGELAELVHDSLIDSSAQAADHYLKFEHGDLTMYVHVAEANDHTDLCCRTEPAAVRTASLHSTRTGPVQESRASARGKFSFPAVRHGLVRVSLDAPNQPTIWSDWFRV